MTVKDKFKCWWSNETGWHFSFGKKRLWETVGTFRVADLVDGYLENSEDFIDLVTALNYMRTGVKK